MDILKDKCRVHPLTKKMPRIKRKLSKVFKKKYGECYLLHGIRNETTFI